jgi:hypothetical protein
MTSTFAVTTVPMQLLSPGRRKDTLLCNVGTETVYLSENPDVSPGNGVPLNPQIAVTWDNDLNLWVVVSQGRGILITQDTRGSNFNDISNG